MEPNVDFSRKTRKWTRPAYHTKLEYEPRRRCQATHQADHGRHSGVLRKQSRPAAKLHTISAGPLAAVAWDMDGQSGGHARFWVNYSNLISFSHFADFP